MKFRILLLPLLFVGLIGFGCQEEGDYAGSEPMTQETEVDFATAMDAVRTQFDQAIAQGDAAAAAALYTADAKSYRPDGTMGSGAEGIAAAYQGMLDMGFNAVTLTPTETIDLGDWGWEIGAYVYTGQSAEGDTLSFEGEYTTLVTKADGMWKMHRVVAFAKREPPSDEAMMAGDDTMPMAQESQAEVMESIQASIDQFTQAVAQGNAAAVAALYTADANLYDAEGELSSGTEAITAGYQEIFDLGIKTITIELVETVHQGDAAWQLGRYTFTGESAEGAAFMMKGEYASLLMQEEGMWKAHRSVAFATRKAPAEEMPHDEM